jgi:hypothetical protein
MKNFVQSILGLAIIVGGIAIVLWAFALTWTLLTLTAFEMLNNQTPTILKWMF